MTLKKITYFAFAVNKKGNIEQLFIIRRNGKPVSQEWTEKIYSSQKEAELDMIRLNCN